MGDPRFWQQNGQWCCAIPRPDPFAECKIPGRGPDWWKRFGLIGRGDTREQALADLQDWQRASDFVASIY